MNCTSCGAEISRQSTLCRDCAHDIHVKYVPDEETIWATAKAIRESWMFGDGVAQNSQRLERVRGVTLVGSRPRGGVLCLTDDAEKALREAERKKAEAGSLELFRIGNQ